MGTSSRRFKPQSHACHPVPSGAAFSLPIFTKRRASKIRIEGKYRVGSRNGPENEAAARSTVVFPENVKMHY